MKHRLLILILLVFLKPSWAQNGFEANYGLSLSGNFTSVNIEHENYIGIGMGGIGLFYQRPISPYHASRYLNRLDFTLEPGLTWLGFRDNNSDKRYESNFFDLGLVLNYIPDRMSEDLRIFAGVRPSYLIYSTSSILEFGTYREINRDTQNLNRAGNFDFSGVAGIHVSLGEVASLELRYVHPFTSSNTSLHFKGRPGSTELALKLSAIRIRDKIVREETGMVAELNHRSTGILLVMLEEPNEKLISQLMQDRKVEDAEYVRNLQRQTNLNIIREFRDHWDFCKVEFFMNSDANQVNKGSFERVFLDDQLNTNKSVSFDTTNYFLASFVEDISDYTHKADYGLYFYDKHFIQLKKPYNTGINGMGLFIAGDPMNYFRRVKTGGYSSDEFRKVIRKVNAKLQAGRIPQNQ